MLVYNKQFIIKYALYEHKSDTNVFTKHTPSPSPIFSFLNSGYSFISKSQSQFLELHTYTHTHTHCHQQRHCKLASLGISKYYSQNSSTQKLHTQTRRKCKRENIFVCLYSHTVLIFHIHNIFLE